jgi:hypothetical protein
MAELKMREEYIVCLSSTDESTDFKEYLTLFAHREDLDIFDRSNEAERELEGLEHARDVLDSTEGPLILMTVERTNSFRISITNAGLGKNINLTFRYNPESRPPEASEVLRFAMQKYSVSPADADNSSSPSCESL